MPRLTIETTDDDREPSLDEVRAIVNATRVLEVRLDEVHAGPVRRIGSEINWTLEALLPQVAVQDSDDRLLVRLHHQVVCDVPDQDPDPTKMDLFHVVAFEVKDELATNWPALGSWIEMNVYFIAYPYLRQTVNALSSSLGLPGIVLDYLSRNENPFGQALVKVEQDAIDPDPSERQSAAP